MPAYMVYYTGSKPRSYRMEAESEEKVRGLFESAYPHIKKIDKVERLYESKACQEMSVMWSQEIADFFISLAKSSTRLYLEVNDEKSNDVESKYYELTGDVLTPERGKYNIAPDDKWGVEGTIYFDSSIQIPSSLGLRPEKPGQINSHELLWALIRMGFRVGAQQDQSAIIEKVPTQFREAA